MPISLGLILIFCHPHQINENTENVKSVGVKVILGDGQKMASKPTPSFTTAFKMLSSCFVNCVDRSGLLCLLLLFFALVFLAVPDDGAATLVHRETFVPIPSVSIY